MNVNKFLSIGSLVIVVAMLAFSIFLVVAGGLAGVLVMATGAVLVYYLILFILTKVLTGQPERDKIVYPILWLLFLIPIIWVSIDAEGLTNWLMSGINLDMK